MKHKIIEKPAFSVVGKSIKTNCNNGQNAVDIPAFWGNSMKDGSFTELMPLAGELGMLGVCVMGDMETGDLTYMIGIEVGENAPTGLEKVDIPSATWAVFQTEGQVNEVMFSAFEYIGKWMEEEAYTYADAPSLEVYPNMDRDMEIWVAVIRK